MTLHDSSPSSRCGQCKLPTPLVAFATYRKPDGSLGRRGICGLCRNQQLANDSKEAREWRKAYNKRTRTKRGIASKERRDNARMFVDEFKKAPCMDCGGTFPPVAMDFDHARGNKHKSVAMMVSSSYKLDLIRDEIAKCDLVCANCHRVRTAERKDNVAKPKALRTTPQFKPSAPTPALPPYELSRGENAHNSLLTEKIIREAHRRRTKGEAIRDIAKSLKVPAGPLFHALSGVTWGHLKLPPIQGRAPARCGICRKLGHRQGTCPKR